MEAVKTNIIGTDNVITAAVENKVERVVFLSTDKAAYDEFIILGDASSGTGLEISEQKEVDETINRLLMMCPEIVNVTTVIAWRRAENQRTIIYSWYKSVTEV